MKNVPFEIASRFASCPARIRTAATSRIGVENQRTAYPCPLFRLQRDEDDSYLHLICKRLPCSTPALFRLRRMALDLLCFGRLSMVLNADAPAVFSAGAEEVT